MALSCGPVVAISVAIAALPLGLGWKGLTIVTPGTSRSASAMPGRALAEPCDVSATISIGPLNPAPKPSAVSS